MKWKILKKIENKVITELKNYPDIVKQLLFNRGIKTSADAKKYLDPQITDIHDPFLLSDIEKAIEVILYAKAKKKRIFIYGDYDVDGVVATSILWDFLYRKLNINVLPYIPSRFEEGYGMSKTGLDHIVKNGGNLVITVDCGIKDNKLIDEYSKQKKLKFIITDHHTIPEEKNGRQIINRNALAIIHPKHPKSKYPFKEISGATVAWKLICALSKELKNKLTFDPMNYLDLVSLTVVTDIMPLIDENRVIVHYGLKHMKKTDNIGLRALILNSKIDFNNIDTYHYGFVIGPRLNAAGRIEHAIHGVRLLSTGSHAKAIEYAEKISALNYERQKLTKEILNSARERVMKEMKNEKLLFLWGENWPEGIVGLVAGKLQEEFSRPVFVASVKNGIAVGSARSITSFNVTEAISISSDILIKYGGHSQAAGFSLDAMNLFEFKERLLEFANEKLTDDDFIKTLVIDVEIDIKDIDHVLINWLEKFKPFGLANSTPTFLIKKCVVLSKKNIGKEGNHTKIILGQGNHTLEMLAFYQAHKFQNVKINDKIDVVGNIELNSWNGYKTVQLKLIDFTNSF